MIRATLVGALCWTLAPNALAASTEPAGLTEEAAVRLALTRSRQLGSLEVDVEIAQARRDSAGWIENPTLRIADVAVSHEAQRTWLRDELEIGVRWRPPGLGELAEEEQRAAVREWEGRVRAARGRSALSARVRRAFSDVVLNDALARLAARRVEIETARVGLVDRMKDLGQRSIVYATKTRLWVAEARTTLSRYERRRSAARRRLARLTGAAEDIAVADADLPAVTGDAETLARRALARRPEQKLLEARTELAARRHDRERYRLIPWLSFVQLAARLDWTQDDRGEVMLGIDLPVFDWNSGNIEAARLAHERRETRSEALDERIELRVRDTLATYEEARQDFEATRADAETLVTSARAVIEQAGAHKTVPTDELWELERTIVDSEQLVHDKRHRAALAAVDLCEALGVDSLSEVVGGGRQP